MALKEYSILDCEQEEKFERITALAGRIFEAPICLVSLVDIGRQWFMSNRGLGDIRETSRQVSFCAHAIQSKDEDIFVVPETHEDERFVNNGLVTGPPFIRFYAGVPLKSPEGYKLGTFCIIDTKPRPQGLSLSEKQNLRELTAMTLDTMVERKQEMKRIRDEKTRLMACAAHDLMSPLTGIRLNLELLMEESKKLDSHQKDLIKSSLQCSEIIERICRTTIEGFRGERDGDTSSTINKEEGHVGISELVKNVNRIVTIYPKKVPLFINVDENVPETIISDDLKLFRSILNYLTNACKYTEKGSIHLRIYTRKAGNRKQPDMELGGLPGSLMTPMTDVLVVECEDTGQGVALEKLATLFTPLADVESNEIDPETKVHSSGLGLYSVANEIGSLGGNYGVFPREDLSESKECIDDQSISGSVFWFTIPLVKPAAHLSSMSDEGVTLPNDAFTSTQIASASSLSSAESTTRLKRPLDKSNSTFSSPKRSAPSVPPSAVTSPKKTARKKCVLVIDDSITIRKALAKGFERLGFMVDEAQNGHQGFNCMKQKPYDLVMCDFLMPIMDGVDVVRKIRAWEHVSRPWYRQHIVGLSAHANGKDAEAGLKAGMDRFMSKPIPVKTLKDLTGESMCMYMTFHLWMRHVGLNIKEHFCWFEISSNFSLFYDTLQFLPRVQTSS
jgi:signal transduction histidine kinase/CheY-like chemotaxis protein